MVEAADNPSPLKLSGTNSKGAVQLAQAKVEASNDRTLAILFFLALRSDRTCLALNSKGCFMIYPPYVRGRFN